MFARADGRENNEADHGEEHREELDERWYLEARSEHEAQVLQIEVKVDGVPARNENNEKGYVPPEDICCQSYGHSRDDSAARRDEVVLCRAHEKNPAIQLPNDQRVTWPALLLLAPAGCTRGLGCMVPVLPISSTSLVIIRVGTTRD